MLINNHIQGLRAIAVSLVVLAHFKIEPFSGGFIGVDIFFVLSGFLITGILITEYTKIGTINFRSFYARRIKRLLPALIIVAASTAVLSVLLLPVNESITITKSLPFALSWTSNLYFSFTSFDYFNTLSESDLFLHTWSLSVEEQFYLIWAPLLFLVLWSISHKKDQTKHVYFWALISLTLVTLTSFAYSLFLVKNYPIHAYYQMPSRIWQFSLGGTTFLALQTQWLKLNRSPAKTHALGLVGLTLILYAGVFFSEFESYPGWRAIVPTVGTCFLLFAFGHNPPTSYLTQKPLLKLGDMSYSIYLWHWPALIISTQLGLFDNPIYKLLLISGILAISYLSHTFIEKPFWKGKFSKGPLRMMALTSIFAVVMVAGLHQKWVLEQKLSNEQIFFASRLSSDLPSIYQTGCDTWFQDNKLIFCTKQNEGKESRKTALFVGDSIGIQWFTAFANYFSDEHWNLKVLTKSACPMASLDYYYKRIGKTFEICSEWRRNVIELIAREKPELLIIGSSSLYPFSEANWIVGTLELLSKVASHTKQTLIIPGTPTLNFDGPSCLARYYDKEISTIRKQCSSKDGNKYTKQNTASLYKAARSYDNVSVVNLNKLVCEIDTCFAISEEGIPIYRDKIHLSNSFVSSLSNQIGVILNNALRKETPK